MCYSVLSGPAGRAIRPEIDLRGEHIGRDHAAIQQLDDAVGRTDRVGRCATMFRVTPSAKMFCNTCASARTSRWLVASSMTRMRGRL
jgi:hypothetical protein